MNPFFSIIVPCCDVAQYLRECLDSVAKQPFSDWECLLGVEESKDDTEKIAREYAAKDPRFKVFTGPRTGSCSASRNTGIDMATGEYIIFLDGDDTIVEGSLQRLHDKISAHAGADLYPCAILAHNEFNGNIELRDNFSTNSPSDMTGIEATLEIDRLWAGKICPMLQLTVFRRMFLNSHNLKCIHGLRRQDSEFTPRALYFAQRVVPLHEAFYIYRIRRNSISTEAKGRGHFLRDWAVLTKSLFAFYTTVSQDRDFDSRVTTCWIKQWIPPLYFNWFNGRAISSVPRRHRVETLQILFSEGFNDFRNLMKHANFAKRVAGWTMLLFVKHPSLRWIAECGFRLYFFLIRIKSNNQPSFCTDISSNAAQKCPCGTMNNQLPKKVLIYHRSLDSSASGGEYLPLLLISELQRRKCEITLALDWQSDIASCAKSLGIEVDASAINILYIKPRNRLLQKLDIIIPFYRSMILRRQAKLCDICISTFNIFDFGKPAHHFILALGINNNSFKNYYMHRSCPTGIKLLDVKFRSFFAEHLLRPLLRVRSTRSILKNPDEHIYPNSHYVERTMREFFGPFNSTLFYPPTTFTPHSGCAKHCPLKVVYLGLLSPHKHLDDIISIVENARMSSKKDIELHIGGKLLQTDYCNYLKSVSAGKQWIRFVGPKYGFDKEEFLCSGSYAIHATREEAFGIAVTEYLKAGIVPIVPNEGGTCEIVNNKDLEYSDNDHAAAILSRLVTDETFKKTMKRHCMLRANLFSFQLYITRQRALLDKIIQESHKE